MTDQQSGLSTTSSSAIGEAGVDHLSLKVIWAYSVPMIAFGIMGMLFATYLMKFATDELLIAPAVPGLTGRCLQSTLQAGAGAIKSCLPIAGYSGLPPVLVHPLS